ncbi:MAG TPA: glutathione S-transferase family protein [Moraxellaceae bacterium]
MPEFILHNYATSPFSQKVRSMLGYAGLPWRAVTVREFPPRPHLEALAGGYRKVPVAQIGADVFCDSHLIAEEIAALAGKPELVLGNIDVEAQAWVQRVDYDLFFACVFASGNSTLRRKAGETLGTIGLLRLVLDRITARRSRNAPPVSLRQARPIVKAHAADLEQRLTQDFLFGATPNHADFSTFHGLWMIHFLAESSQLKGFPKLVAWLDRMHAFGNGPSQAMAIEESLAVAKHAAPREIAEEYRRDALIGKRVSIEPDDYMLTPTPGVLVGATPTRWILAREHARTGTVHVHFPRKGYVLKPA